MPHRKMCDRFCLLKNFFPAVIFLDTPLEIRLVRQVQHEGFLDTESARKHLLSRDEIKEKSGVPALKEIADELVNNSGTLQDLYRKIDQVIQRHLP